MQQTYSIGDLSREFDITTRSIRFYEDQGLLAPSRRGQSRIYSKGDRVRLRLIMRGKRLGFSLAEIRETIDLYDASPSKSVIQLEQLLSIIRQKKEMLEQQARDIAEIQLELTATEERCQEALEELQNSGTENLTDG
jgi:DNA-binding transcriptional MerR regulator